MRRSAHLPGFLLVLAVAGCNHEPNPDVAHVPAPADLAVNFAFPPEPDLYSPRPDGYVEPEVLPRWDPRCGPALPCASCNVDLVEHFALKADDQHYTFVDDSNVVREPNGNLRL